MSDLISRQAAIDEFLTELTKRERTSLLHTWSTVEVKYFIAKILEQLPSAQPSVSKTEIVGDVISRQAALDALTCKFRITGKENAETVVAVIDEFNNKIKALPSAHPEFDAYCDRLWKNAYERGKKDAQPGWIPCGERLPEEDGQYLITVKYKHVNDSYEDVYAEHGEFYNGRWDMFCFGHCGEVEDIIAWMPLPAPYRPEGGQG